MKIFIHELVSGFHDIDFNWKLIGSKVTPLNNKAIYKICPEFMCVWRRKGGTFNTA